MSEAEAWVKESLIEPERKNLLPACKCAHSWCCAHGQCDLRLLDMSKIIFKYLNASVAIGNLPTYVVIKSIACA